MEGFIACFFLYYILASLSVCFRFRVSRSEMRQTFCALMNQMQWSFLHYFLENVIKDSEKGNFL